MARIGVAGAGAWGTALAVIAARAGHAVTLWGRNRSAVDKIAATGRNEAYLPGIALPDAIAATAEPERLRGCEFLLLAVPAQAVRQALCLLPDKTLPLVITAKGLERATGLRLSEVAAAEWPGAPIAALSGPSFALEVAGGLPTAVTIASADAGLARTVAAQLASPAFRPYPSDDLLGVELAGALKNVIAIAAGAAMGMGLGESARAALITRGLAELSRLALALGARRETLMGLAGLGDLILTATSLTSRNTSFGYALARGSAARDLMADGTMLSEGAFTAEAACRLGAQHGVELPIAQAVSAVVAGERALDATVGALLARPVPDGE